MDNIFDDILERILTEQDAMLAAEEKARSETAEGDRQQADRHEVRGDLLDQDKRIA